MLKSFYTRLSQHADQRPDHHAFVSERVTLSYAELLEQAKRGCFYLRSQGIGAGTTVGLSIEDEVDHLVAALSLMFAGAKHIALATFDPLPGRLEIAERIGMTHVISPDKTQALEGISYVHWPQALDPFPETEAFEQSETQGELYLKTSGTTGKPNIIVFTEDQLAHQGERDPDYGEDRLLQLASVEHNNSKRHRLYSIWMGGTSVFREKENFSVIDFVLKHDVTNLGLAKIHAADLAKMPEAKQLSHIKIRISGTIVPMDVRKAVMENVTPHLYVRYGTTESGSIAIAFPSDHQGADETVGHPIEGVELQVVDEHGTPLPAGQSGAIRTRAKGIAMGYFDNPEAAENRFKNGWFYPGDVGAISADGQLLFQGRGDDMMILNGINIFPAEIEQVLERYPGVDEAVALSIESRVHGQIPVAVVKLKEGAEIDLPALRIFARDLLSLRAPRKVIIVDKIPRSVQGKVLRRELKTLF